MLEYLRYFEKLLIKILMVAMTVVLGFATLDLLVLIIKYAISGQYFLISVDDLLDIFGLFMLVLIGIELLETIMKTYASNKQPHYEVVLSVAIIAISRKVIILDIKKVDSFSLLGIAAIVISLAAGYYIMKKSNKIMDTEE